MCTENSKTALAFIGNGFDVALGFETKYSDFYKKSKLLKEYAEKGNSLCAHILNNVKGELWKDLECGLYQYSIELTKKVYLLNKSKIKK